MLGPWKDDKEMIECIMYWQKRALEAEQWLEESLDGNEGYFYIILEERDKFRQMELERDYWKQQFLDKDREMQLVIKRVVTRANDIGTEESDDPWKYRS